MDTNSDHPDDLSELERRLSARKPASAGLDADAMLFAAGRAAARPGAARFVWPTLAISTSVLAAVLGVALTAERTECQRLAQLLRHQPETPDVVSTSPQTAIVVPPEPSAREESSPDSFLAAHRALEQGLDAWPARTIRQAETLNPPLPTPTVLRAGQWNALLDP